MIVVYFYAHKFNWPRGERSSWKEKFSAFLDAIWALIAPIIILGGIITGVVTATEAGVITVVYSLL